MYHPQMCQCTGVHNHVILVFFFFSSGVCEHKCHKSERIHFLSVCSLCRVRSRWNIAWHVPLPYVDSFWPHELFYSIFLFNFHSSPSMWYSCCSCSFTDIIEICQTRMNKQIIVIRFLSVWIIFQMKWKSEIGVKTKSWWARWDICQRVCVPHDIQYKCIICTTLGIIFN